MEQKLPTSVRFQLHLFNSKEKLLVHCEFWKWRHNSIRSREQGLLIGRNYESGQHNHIRFDRTSDKREKEYHLQIAQTMNWKNNKSDSRKEKVRTVVVVLHNSIWGRWLKSKITGGYYLNRTVWKMKKLLKKIMFIHPLHLSTTPLSEWILGNIGI